MLVGTVIPLSGYGHLVDHPPPLVMSHLCCFDFRDFSISDVFSFAVPVDGMCESTPNPDYVCTTAPVPRYVSISPLASNRIYVPMPHCASSPLYASLPMFVSTCMYVHIRVDLMTGALHRYMYAAYDIILMCLILSDRLSVFDVVW